MVALVIADHLVRQMLLRRTGSLGSVRNEIDFTDDMLMVLLSRRQELVREVGRLKRKGNVPIPDPRRERQIMGKRLALAADANLTPEFVKAVYKAVFEHSRRVQRKG